MKSMVELSHDFLLPTLHSQAICIDATLGKGKDAQFFLDHSVKKVYGFEIQKEEREFRALFGSLKFFISDSTLQSIEDATFLETPGFLKGQSLRDF